jgi:anti-anti-sigma regulatory factor
VLRIETNSDGETTTIRLIGRMQSEHLDELKRQMERPRFVLDLAELTLIDVDVVRFLNACKLEGIEFVNCSPYIREWMRREEQEA